MLSENLEIGFGLVVRARNRTLSGMAECRATLTFAAADKEMIAGRQRGHLTCAHCCAHVRTSIRNVEK